MSRRSVQGDARPSGNAPIAPRRIDQLAQIVDCCLEANRLADVCGEKFLAYLLGMAIQETRSAMRSDLKSGHPALGDVAEIVTETRPALAATKAKRPSSSS